MKEINNNGLFLLLIILLFLLDLYTSRIGGKRYKEEDTTTQVETFEELKVDKTNTVKKTQSKNDGKLNLYLMNTDYKHNIYIGLSNLTNEDISFKSGKVINYDIYRNKKLITSGSYKNEGNSLLPNQLEVFNLDLRHKFNNGNKLYNVVVRLEGKGKFFTLNLPLQGNYIEDSIKPPIINKKATTPPKSTLEDKDKDIDNLGDKTSFSKEVYKVLEEVKDIKTSNLSLRLKLDEGEENIIVEEKNIFNFNEKDYIRTGEEVKELPKDFSLYLDLEEESTVEELETNVEEETKTRTLDRPEEGLEERIYWNKINKEVIYLEEDNSYFKYVLFDKKNNYNPKTDKIVMFLNQEEDIKPYVLNLGDNLSKFDLDKLPMDKTNDLINNKNISILLVKDKDIHILLTEVQNINTSLDKDKKKLKEELFNLLKMK